MKMKPTIFVVVCVMVVAVASAVEPNDVVQLFSGTVSRVSSQVTHQFSNILTRTASGPIYYCPRLQESDLKLLLYTRRKSNRPVVLNPNDPVRMNPKGQVILIMHGWLSNPTSFGFPQLKDAYLRRYDCNLIMVDWSISAFQSYKTAVCYLEQIAQVIANLLCLLDREQNIPLSSVHLVGHSLGGQMSASISQKTLVMCEQQVGRITAMDPARPYYQGLPKDERLDKDDAPFVDVIHTNEGSLGYHGNCGDVDFYVNCGTVQPGCPSFNLVDIIDHPLPTVSCDHFRSVEFMAESVNSDGFKAIPCPGCPTVCYPDLTNGAEITMGENCPANASGAYVIYTNSESPFALGSENSIGRVIRY